MIWLTDDIATAAFSEASRIDLDKDVSIVDVRDLVDKQGNDPAYIQNKIESALGLLRDHRRIVICCDYGMSRSNSIATGVISKWKGIPFSEAVNRVRSLIDESGVKIEMLNTVYEALLQEGSAGGKKKQTVGRQILLTGAGGFIGKRLSPLLGGTATVHSPSSKEIDLMENVLELDLYVKEKQIDSILHLANPKIFTTGKSMGDSLVMLKNVLDVCRTNHVRIVYLSGWEIYSGYQSNGLLADENLKANPKGTYGETKWFCEQLIKQYGEVYGLKYQIIRSGPVYGPGGEKPKFIYNFIDKALNGKKIFTHRYLNGPPILDLLYIDDLIQILDLIAASPFEGEINIGSGIGTSTFEIAGLICQLTGSKSEIKQVPVADHSANIIMDNRLARSMFPWSPRTDIRTGLLQILNTYTHHG